MREKYIQKLVQCISEAGLDAVMVCPGEEMKFLLGFSPMLCERFQGLFVKRSGEMFYICNLLYQEELQERFAKAAAGRTEEYAGKRKNGEASGKDPRQLSEISVYSWFDGEVMTRVVEKIFREQGLLGKKIGVNSDAQAFNILEIMEKVDVTFCNAKPLLEEMRIRKEKEELDALRKSASIVDQVFEEVQAVIRPGVSEKQVQEFLLNRMSELGGGSPECIVGVGANSSYPHYCDCQCIIQEQDVVLLDYGCTWQGLYSDMSRTVFVGGVTEKQRECYELVKRSNEAAEAMVKEGTWIPDIDRKAREVLDEKGYAKTLINRLGHGIGYTIHEAPDIKQSNPRKLEKGMAFSIEPGIYLGGEFGIRIEDIVIVNEKGEAEILNKASKELIVL